jgi:hypothetical protein
VYQSTAPARAVVASKIADENARDTRILVVP